MFIDFEGIGGSGKTTLSNLVGHRLSRLGLKVTHARLGGDPPTRRVAALEALTQGRAHALHPRTELFLELAEQVECIEDVIRPALGRGEVCLTEGYLPRTLAKAIAGLSFDAAGSRATVALAAAEIEPEVVVLLDVDPDLGRHRRKVAARMRGAGSPRESPLGTGLQTRLREGLLGLAREDPARWIVVRNEGLPLFLLAERIADALLARMHRREGEIVPMLPATVPPPACAPDQLEETLFARLDALEPREPALCAHLLGGLPGLAAMQRRLAFAERFPEIVARGLAGFTDESTRRLLELLAALTPEGVAAALAGNATGWAHALRVQLLPLAPAEVARGLVGLDDGASWELREQAIAAGAHDAVLEGLAGLDGSRAWRLRSAGLGAGRLTAVAKSLSGLGDADADALRRHLFGEVPLEVLGGLAGVASAEAFGLRESLLERAPAVVLRSIDGLDGERAMRLRERMAERCPEALASLAGLSSEPAWQLRTRYLERWPAAVARSLRGLAHGGLGEAMIARLLRTAGERLVVLRDAYAVSYAEAAAQEARWDPEALQ